VLRVAHVPRSTEIQPDDIRLVPSDKASVGG
jgi:hypothetical protein